MTDVLGVVVSNATGLAGVIAAVGATYSARTDRRRLAAEVLRSGVDASQVVTDTALTLLEPLRTELTSAREEIRRLRAREPE